MMILKFMCFDITKNFVLSGTKGKHDKNKSKLRGLK